MQLGNLVLAGAAVVVAGGTYAALEFGWWPSAEMRNPEGTSHASRQPVVQMGPAEQPGVA